MRRWLVPIVLLAPPVAYGGYGGGGFLVHQAWVPDAPKVGLESPGFLHCFGGLGYGVEDGLRTGGEGHVCGGRDAGLVYGGFETGWQDAFGPTFLTAYGVVGGGVIGVEDPYGVGDWGGLFAYAQPTVGAGVSFGWGAIELDVYWMIHAPLHGWADEPFVDGFGISRVGAQVAVLFGDFREQGLHPEPYRPLPPPPEPEEEEDEEPPLAIPGDEPPRPGER